MAIYGDAAVAATRLYPKAPPPDLWDLVMSRLTESPSSQAKHCPRLAYLGLCEAGLVQGIPKGKYLKNPSLNAQYAVRAVTLLRSQPGLAVGQDKLWRLSCGCPGKRHNGQMDVVLGLWNRGLVE